MQRPQPCWIDFGRGTSLWRDATVKQDDDRGAWHTRTRDRKAQLGLLG